MKTNVQKWGNSLALRIPKLLAGQVHIEKGTEVEIRVVEDVLEIRVVHPDVYSLEDLLSEVKDVNLHGEVDTDPPVGGEVW